jgi:hypothetical protein
MVLAIDPFDQPNVQEAKDATRALLDAYRANGGLPQPAPLVAEPGMAAYGDAKALGDDPVTVGGAVSALVQTARPSDYFAVLAYLPGDPATVEQLQRLRALMRDGLGLATTLGIGPRFLHSTGQLHKGGPPTGVFVQVVGDDPDDVDVPGADYTFSSLKHAQADGDLLTLRRHGLRAARVSLDDLVEVAR